MTFSGFGNPRLNFPVSLKIGMDWTIQTAESRRPPSLSNTDKIYNCPAHTNFFRIFPSYLLALVNYTNFKAGFFFFKHAVWWKAASWGNIAVQLWKSKRSELAWWDPVLTHNCSLQGPCQQYLPRRKTHSNETGVVFPVFEVGQCSSLLLAHRNRFWQVWSQHISYS